MSMEGRIGTALMPDPETPLGNALAVYEDE